MAPKITTTAASRRLILLGKDSTICDKIYIVRTVLQFLIAVKYLSVSIKDITVVWATLQGNKGMIRSWAKTTGCLWQWSLLHKGIYFFLLAASSKMRDPHDSWTLVIAEYAGLTDTDLKTYLPLVVRERSAFTDQWFLEIVASCYEARFTGNWPPGNHR